MRSNCLSDVELPGVVAQHHAVGEQPVRVDAAPQGALGGDAYRVRRDVQRGETEPVEVRQPGCLIGEFRPRLRRQAGDQRQGDVSSPARRTSNASAEKLACLSVSRRCNRRLEIATPSARGNAAMRDSVD